MQQLIYSLEVSQVRLCQLPHIMVSMAMCPGIYGSSIELAWHNVQLHHTVGHFLESSFLHSESENPLSFVLHFHPRCHGYLTIMYDTLMLLH